MPVLMLKRIDESPIGEWNDDDYSDSNREVEVRWGSAHWLTVSSGKPRRLTVSIYRAAAQAAACIGTQQRPGQSPNIAL